MLIFIAIWATMCAFDDKSQIIYRRQNFLWWRHQILIFSSLLILCVGNAPATSGFPAQKPVTRSFEVFFDLHLNKRLSKQSRCQWFETPSHSLWRHWNGNTFSLGDWYPLGNFVKHNTIHLVKITFSHYVMITGNFQFSCCWINSLVRKYILYIIFDSISGMFFLWIWYRTCHIFSWKLLC